MTDAPTSTSETVFTVNVSLNLSLLAFAVRQQTGTFVCHNVLLGEDELRDYVNRMRKIYPDAVWKGITFR